MPALARGVIPGRAPSFPMPLDHPSSGLRGVTGSVQAGTGPARVSAPSRPAPTRAAPPKTSIFNRPLQQATRENLRTGGRLQQFGAEHPGERRVSKGIGPFGLFGNETRSAKEWGEIKRAPISTGIVAPTGIPGLKFTVGAALAGKGLEKITGPGGGLYQEALQTAIGGPRGAVEAVKHPVAALSGLKELAEHPGRRPLQSALIGVGVLGGLNQAIGGAGRIGGAGWASRERPSGIVGAPGYEHLEVPRQYGAGPLTKGPQRAIENLKEATGKNPRQLNAVHVPFFGSRLRRAIIGGKVAPGQVDIHRGSENIVADMKAAKAHEYVDSLTPSRVLRENGVRVKGREAQAHNESIMPFLEGYARNPDTYWADLRGREARLTAERARLTDETALKRNQAQLDQLHLIQEYKESIDRHLALHEQTTRRLTDSQAHSFNEEVRQGHLQPDQFHARLIPYGLEHGEALGRGPLHYQEKGPLHPLVSRVEALQRELAKGGHTPGKELDLRRQIELGKEQWAHLKRTYQISPSGHYIKGLYDANNQRVDMQHVEDAFKRETRGREPGFVTHKDVELPVATRTFIRGERPSGVTRSRTGEHFASGNYENHFGVVHREFRRSARNLSRYRSANHLYQEFGVNHPTGTKEQMIDLAKRLNADTSKHAVQVRRSLGKWVLVTRAPERVLTSDAIHDSRYQMLNDMSRVEGRSLAEEKHTLLPEHVLNRLEDHFAAERPNSPILRELKRFTGYQRHVALYSTPRWPVGVHQENMIRLAAINTNPLVALPGKLGLLAGRTSKAYKTGAGFLEGAQKLAGDDLRKVAADPTYTEPERAYARANAAMLEHGSLVGSEIRSLVDLNRSPDLIDHPPDWTDPIANAKGIKQGLAAWEKWKAMLGSELSNMENRARIAAAGHILIKQYGTFSKEVQGLVAREDKIVREVAQSKTNPVEFTRFSEDLLDAIGNWNHLTPFTREMRSFWAPFGLWWLNSVKFMFKTMPIEHPLKTALWTAMVSATQPDERPEFKQGSISVNMPFLGPVDYSLIHYSPSDIGHQPVKTAESMVTPWFMQAYLRAGGVNPQYLEPEYKGKEGEGKGPANVKAATEETGMSFVPFGQLMASIARRGGAPNPKATFPTFEAKPGTAKGLPRALGKFVSPVPFSFGKATTGRPERPERKERKERSERPERSERKER